jgi:LuxR family quorum-sensing system transcriptional regulator CciR
MRKMRWALEFAFRAQRTTSARELGDLLSDATREMGFSCYGLVRCDPSHAADEDDIHLFNFPAIWTDEIHSKQLFRIDPVRAAAFAHDASKPNTFLWSETDRIIRLTADQRAMMAASAQAGLSSGYAIPVRIPDEPAGVCSFGLKDGQDFPYSALAEAELIGRFAFEAARRLKARNARTYFSPGSKSWKHNSFLGGLMGL